MIKKIAFVLGALALAVLGYAAIKPSDYTVSRSITVNAPVEKVYPFLNSSRLADQWGPWKEVDPGAKMNLTGPETGPGAKTSWDSSGQLGTGSATIVESNLNQSVKIKLAYTKPFEMEQLAEYSLKPAATPGQSIVTWSVGGRNNYVCRLMGVFMNMDKIIGAMFEKGLSNLKTLVEKSS